MKFSFNTIAVFGLNKLLNLVSAYAISVTKEKTPCPRLGLPPEKRDCPTAGARKYLHVLQYSDVALFIFKICIFTAERGLSKVWRDRDACEPER